MNYFDPPHHHLPSTNWQVLGQLKLAAGSNPDGTSKAWLMNILSGFSLPGDLISRLLVSLEEVTMQVLSPNSAEDQVDFLEIVVFGPAEQTAKGLTWGFFRVERTSTESNIESANGHRAEYYLYLDSKMGK